MAEAERWYVRTDDGSVYGPADGAALRAWVRDGRVEPSSLLSRDGETWFAPQACPELEMSWLVETEPGRIYGPFHRATVMRLAAEGKVAAGARFYRLHEQPIDRDPPPRTVEKLVEVPVERVVEKLVEKRVEVPIERVVEKLVEVPVERIVEKVVERRVEVPVEKVVEKVVEVPVERIVEKVVERRVEVPVEKIVERVVEVPVERIVERVVEKVVQVEVPAVAASEVIEPEVLEPEVLEPRASPLPYADPHEACARADGRQRALAALEAKLQQELAEARRRGLAGILGGRR